MTAEPYCARVSKSTHEGSFALWREMSFEGYGNSPASYYCAKHLLKELRAGSADDRFTVKRQGRWAR